MKRHHSLSILVILTIIFWNPSNALLDQGFNVTRANWFFNGILKPETVAQLPEACVTAYTKSIDCNLTILMSPNVDLKKSTLEDACEPECATSLLTYERGVREACAGADLKALGLSQSWLSAVINGQAGILLYWKQCLREMGTEKICDISQSDYEIACEAITAETANSAAVREFCSDTCLTQTVVLNVPTEENLDDMKEMCKTNITDFPFIEAMQFAGLIKRDNDGSVIAANATVKVSSRGSRSAVGWGMEVLLGVTLLMCFLTLF
ncbi:hypothetical protein L873DRAFT_1729979 [Choiromyces venosus 120613-1]|uniref:Extracellular membrane protein CFEM domain-containing protein n=1 Tax=Choiromyces venosus 120613-1 TaxID=1336337 RepID=A0A3N4K4K4_9PEZI|nr:hypothetical protein L873DRAFT_1729979 [Choiromyces venosus 120613-1]